MAATFVGRQLTFLHEALQARRILTFVGSLASLKSQEEKKSREVREFQDFITHMAPDVPTQISLMGKRSRASRKVAFERLLARVDSHVANQFVLLAELFAAPFAFELPNVVMENFDVSLELEESPPRLAGANFARIPVWREEEMKMFKICFTIPINSFLLLQPCTKCTQIKLPT